MDHTVWHILSLLVLVELVLEHGQRYSLSPMCCSSYSFPHFTTAVNHEIVFSSQKEIRPDISASESISCSRAMTGGLVYQSNGFRRESNTWLTMGKSESIPSAFSRHRHAVMMYINNEYCREMFFFMICR
jgi:hypothetical protein